MPRAGARTGSRIFQFRGRRPESSRNARISRVVRGIFGRKVQIMDADLKRLLALAAADRLELAEILRRSVGYPADIEALVLPDWELRELLRRLSACDGERQAGELGVLGELGDRG